jgi:ABC-type amino acid transport substrate-binding protein
VKLAAIDGDQTYISARIDFPKAQVYALPQNASGSDQFLAVMTGKADAAILDAGGYNMFAKENPGKLVRVAGVKAERTYGERLAVKQGDYLLRDMLNVGIDVLLDNGVIQKIVQGYTNTYYMPENHYTAHE